MVGYWKLENIKLETQMQKKKKKQSNIIWLLSNGNEDSAE